jgi:hypothetical protein
MPVAGRRPAEEHRQKQNDELISFSTIYPLWDLYIVDLWHQMFGTALIERAADIDGQQGDENTRRKGW